MKAAAHARGLCAARPLPPAALMLLVILGACRGPATILEQPSPPPGQATVAPSPSQVAGLTEAQTRSLASLERIDPFPLYTMHYSAAYGRESAEAVWPDRRWSCSLFAALGDPSSRLYGRNFDWDYSPAVLLFTDPPDGYASVSMVDLAYLIPRPEDAASLDEQPLEELIPLLWAPHIPFDGMNERGLAIGMAAVPNSGVSHDPSLPTVDDLELIRWMLDRAGTVDEGLAILRRANVSWGGGPAIHYLIADAEGQSALVEYVGGEMAVLSSTEPWHLATNFHVTAAGEGPIAPPGLCPRYDHMRTTLSAAEGILEVDRAVELLQQVSNEGTQWSVVYDLSQRSVRVVMGGAFDTVYSFSLGD